MHAAESVSLPVGVIVLLLSSCPQVNNINRQRHHCCYRTLYGPPSLVQSVHILDYRKPRGKNDAELTHEDVMPPDQVAAMSRNHRLTRFDKLFQSVLSSALAKAGVPVPGLPSEVDVAGFFAVATLGPW